jgi:hypothetical protein
MLLLASEQPKEAPKPPVVLQMRVWCRVCRRKPGTCQKSVNGYCQDFTHRVEKFENLAQCAEFILTPAFDCDEAIVMVKSENDNPRIICADNLKTEIPIGGDAADVIAWARGVQ